MQGSQNRVLDSPKGNHSGFGELSILPNVNVMKLRKRLGTAPPMRASFERESYRVGPGHPDGPGLPRANAVENQSATGMSRWPRQSRR